MMLTTMIEVGQIRFTSSRIPSDNKIVNAPHRTGNNAETTLRNANNSSQGKRERSQFGGARGRRAQSAQVRIDRRLARPTESEIGKPLIQLRARIISNLVKIAHQGIAGALGGA